MSNTMFEYLNSKMKHENEATIYGTTSWGQQRQKYHVSVKIQFEEMISYNLHQPPYSHGHTENTHVRVRYIVKLMTGRAGKTEQDAYTKCCSMSISEKGCHDA